MSAHEDEGLAVIEVFVHLTNCNANISFPLFLDQLSCFCRTASQQVGQSLLSLPWAFELMGYQLAIICLLGLSIASMWTQALLIGLLSEYRQMIACDINHPRHGDENYDGILS